MEENTESQFDAFEKIVIARRSLLPWWMRFGCWVFMAMGIVDAGCLIAGAFGFRVFLSIYGIETSEALSIKGIVVSALLLFKAVTAYLLWFEKNRAVDFAKWDAISGIVICTANMFLSPFFYRHHFSIGLEIALLVPYFMQMNKIEYQWINREK
jgi:hypothetical protein